MKGYYIVALSVVLIGGIAQITGAAFFRSAFVRVTSRMGFSAQKRAYKRMGAATWLSAMFYATTATDRPQDTGVTDSIMRCLWYSPYAVDKPAAPVYDSFSGTHLTISEGTVTDSIRIESNSRIEEPITQPNCWFRFGRLPQVPFNFSKPPFLGKSNRELQEFSQKHPFTFSAHDTYTTCKGTATLHNDAATQRLIAKTELQCTTELPREVYFDRLSQISEEDERLLR